MGVDDADADSRRDLTFEARVREEPRRILVGCDYE
jgi:hypothetical protein